MGENTFQAWDQVQATSGEHEGKAGVVERCAEGVATVKFDGEAIATDVDTDDLKLLGR